MTKQSASAQTTNIADILFYLSNADKFLQHFHDEKFINKDWASERAIVRLKEARLRIDTLIGAIESDRRAYGNADV